MQSSSRRIWLKVAALAPALTIAPLRPVESAPKRTVTGSPPNKTAAESADAEAGVSFLTQPERAFVEAAVARLIPNDDLGPGAKEAGVAVFIDRQLAGPFGRAETWYMQGPWHDGTPEQGYQSKLNPAKLYRVAIRDIDAHVRKQSGKSFAELDTGGQDALLTALEKKELKLPNAPGDEFFKILLQNTIEGFLADPMYGGNRDFIGWRLIGFPGPRYNYVAEIEQHGKKYEMPMVSIAGRDAGVRKA